MAIEELSNPQNIHNRNVPMQIFKYESEEDHMFNEVRTIEVDGKILFCATDVAKTLGYGNPNDAIIRHCKSDGIVIHEVIDSLGRKQNIKFLVEGNVYRLIVKSQLESAEKFEKWLFDEVIPSIRTKGYYGKIDRAAIPNFLIRYRDNINRIEKGHFSVIGELFVTLGTELSKYGYDIPDKSIDGSALYPDISVGKTFANYLKKINHPDKDKYKKYWHKFPDDRKDQECRQYSYDLLPAFRNFVLDEWVPNYAHNYFKTRDPKALEYLPKILGK